jgi:hypothetical protein
MKCFGYRIKIDIEKSNKIIMDAGKDVNKNTIDVCKDNNITVIDNTDVNLKKLDIDNTLVKTKKYKKKNIPATVKRLVWNKYIGEEIGKAKCLCCNVTDITQLSFHCGHVIAESQGGENTVENLRPICQNCNSSMCSKNFYEFKKMLEDG